MAAMWLWKKQKATYLVGNIVKNYTDTSMIWKLYQQNTSHRKNNQSLQILQQLWENRFFERMPLEMRSKQFFAMDVNASYANVYLDCGGAWFVECINNFVSWNTLPNAYVQEKSTIQPLHCTALLLWQSMEDIIDRSGLFQHTRQDRHIYAYTGMYI